jgi:hypothetical protein
MAVLGRLLFASAERLDLPDLLSIDSFAAGDFKFLLKGLIGDDKPLILRGFDVINPGDAIGSQSLSIRVADSVVLYPGSLAGPFFHGLEEGHSAAQPLVPELRKNATNFVYLTFSTFDTASDTRAFWDPDLDGGNGGEFTQDINTESVLRVDVNVSVSAFPENTIPICRVVVGPSVIESIEDAREQMFRLGEGGVNPDPFSRYNFRNDPTSDFARKEPPTTMSSALDPNPFQGGDKNIQSLKEWMDAVMTKLAEIGGTTFWYEDTGAYGLVNIFLDSLARSFKSKGQWEHSSATPGLLTWTEDIHLKYIADDRDIIIRNANKTLQDEEVMYVELLREAAINSGDVSVDWFNSLNFVNGPTGAFENLEKGDWVKKRGDAKRNYRRVEEFFAADNLGGGVTSPALARSIRLSDVYEGISETQQGEYTKGSYDSSEIFVVARSEADALNGNRFLDEIGGNVAWLAVRSDTIMGVDDITTTSLLAIDITEADGSTAKVTATGHGLEDGDRVTIADSVVGYNGTYVVEVVDADEFYINTTQTGDELGVANAYYATVTTTTRELPGGFQLESAQHGFEDNQTIAIADTSSAFDGSYLIHTRTPTTFTIPVPSGIANVSTGSATLARINVRSEFGMVEIKQGEATGIGEGDSGNIMSFIGMGSLSETYPTYNLPPGYNTLNGQANYNGNVTDNLTLRVAQLTAMMADKAQDKTIKLLPSGYISVTNTTVGPNQEITFNAAPSDTPQLDVVMPSSANNGVVTLSGVLSLAVNQVAYIEVDRNAAFSYASLAALTVANINDVPLDENVLILAVRLGTNEVWLWDGFYVSAGVAPVPSFLNQVVQQNQNLKLVRGGVWSWDLINEDLTLSADAYIQVPILDEVRNTVQAQTINLPDDGDVAYVEINRSGAAPANLIVNVTPINSLATTTNTVIIARRIGDEAIIGENSTRLHHGESKSLEADERIERARVIDLVNTVLPATAAVTIDGVALANGDRVLFAQPALNGIYVVDGIGVAAVWTQIEVFGGSLVPREGDMVAVQDGSAHLNTNWSYFGGAWIPQNYGQIQKDPTGFPNRVDSTISFDDGTRTFTIEPVTTHFDYYIKGQVYRKATPQTVVIPDVEGLYFISFDGDTLTQQLGFTLDLLTDKAYVATVYWDATNDVAVTLGEERHGLAMDNVTHSYLHQTFGTRWVDGLNAGNFTIVGDGTADADAQLSVEEGTIFDEDIRIDIVDGVGAGIFEQELTPIGQFPIYYRDGALGNWRKIAATNFPVDLNTTQINFNEFTGGTWQRTEAGDGNFVAMWVFATNDINDPVIAIMGQREDTSLSDAQTNNTYESLSFGELPSQEMKVLYRVIFETSSTYSNAVNAALRDVRDLRQAVDTSLAAYASSDHQLLSNRNAPGAHEAFAINYDTSTVVGVEPTDDTVQKSLDALDKFFGQLRLRPHSVNGNRVVLSGADVSLTSGTGLIQAVKNLMLSFDGAEIDFSTGEIFESDGVTPLGIDFTPATVASAQYHWYSVTLIPATVNVDNTINAQLVVLSASGDGASPELAPKAPFAKGTQLGAVVIQDDGAGGAGTIEDIAYTNIRQLGTGGGSGSGEGDANELLERLKDQLREGPFEFVTPNIFLTNEDDLIDTGTSTAEFDVANTLFDFDVAGEFIESLDMLDEDFLDENLDVDSIELSAFWNDEEPTLIDPAATYEVSRDGGLHYQEVSMSRIGDTETFRGVHIFETETDDVVVDEYLLANADSSVDLDDGTAREAIAQEFVLADDIKMSSISLWLRRAGAPAGNFRLKLLNNSGGVPSTAANAEVYVGDWRPVADIGLVNTQISEALNKLQIVTGTYHIVLETDAAYQASYSVGVDYIEARSDASAPTVPLASTFNGSVWATHGTDALIYEVVEAQESVAVVSEYDVANADAERILNDTTQQRVSQEFDVAGTSVLRRVTLYINKLGSPSGKIFASIVQDDGGGLPSTDPDAVLVESNAIDIAGIAVDGFGDGFVEVLIPKTVVVAGTYHLVIRSDSEYKDFSYDAGVTELRLREDSSAPTITDLAVFNGTVWAEIAGRALTYKIEGRALELLVKITSSQEAQLKGYGILYSLSNTGIVSGIDNREYHEFDGTLDNESTFLIDKFLPDPSLLKVYEIGTGQVYVFGAFLLDGHNVIFPDNTFNKPGTIKLLFEQNSGGSFDNTDGNAALLAANHLGSTDLEIDRSANGRGILLRRPDGTLREISINNDDEIEIYSVE